MRRALAVAWLLVAAAVWSGFFDLYVSRGAREYLQKSAEHAAGVGPEPAMAAVMASARHDGVMAATSWSLLVLALGWTTVALAGRRPSRAAGRTT